MHDLYKRNMSGTGENSPENRLEERFSSKRGMNNHIT